MAQAIDGILLLDKPLGLSSNSALQKVKRLFMAQKAGHTGSLDPLATGMLPICFGQATKFAQFFIDDDKAYTVIAKLGIQTDSGDTDGKIIREEVVPSIDIGMCEKVLEQFHGSSMQIPPMFSAVKIDGKRLYKLARKGKEIVRPPRPITIKQLKLVDFDMDLHHLKLKVVCSKGTYIRTLVEDLAKALGTCGHVISLHRDYVGGFDPKSVVTLEEIQQLAESPTQLHAKLLPIQSALPAWPKVELSELHTLHFKQGRIIEHPLETSSWIQVYSELGDFVGLGVAPEPNMLKPKRLLCTKSIEKPAVSE